jgi:hypothetical protein
MSRKGHVLEFFAKCISSMKVHARAILERSIENELLKLKE